MNDRLREGALSAKMAPQTPPAKTTLAPIEEKPVSLTPREEQLRAVIDNAITEIRELQAQRDSIERAARAVIAAHPPIRESNGGITWNQDEGSVTALGAAVNALRAALPQSEGEA